MILNSIVFGVYGRMMAYLTSTGNAPEMARVLFSGAMAGLCQAPVGSVIDLVKTRLQMQGKGERRATQLFYSGSIDCLVKAYQKDGFRKGVCRGMLLRTLRDAPGFAAYFGAYRSLSSLLSGTAESFGALRVIVAGGLAGCTSWLVAFPIDVVKSRIQADGVDQIRYSGILDCFRKSYSTEGLAVFTRGLLPTMLRAFPTNAAVLLVVELVLRLAHSHQV